MLSKTTIIIKSEEIIFMNYFNHIHEKVNAIFYQMILELIINSNFYQQSKMIFEIHKNRM